MAAKEKSALPTLTGARIKQRKRDEKEKYDPVSFRDDILTGLKDAGDNLDEISKFLDNNSGKLDYRRYADALFDILIAGGVLQPGGTIKEETDRPYRTSVCVFMCESEPTKMKEHVQVIRNLSRRHKYLAKSFEESMNKILKFLKGFNAEERCRLAVFTGLILGESLVPGSVLTSLLNDTLVKEGLTLQFVTQCFKAWLAEREIVSVGQALRKAKLDHKLLEFMPAQQQTNEAFELHFRKAGLDQLVAYQKSQDLKRHQNKLRRMLDEKFKEDTATSDELKELCREYRDTSPLSDSDVVRVLWRSIMEAIDWNKKEELVAEQARRHLKQYCDLFLPFAEQGTPQLSLLLRVQEYCYENVNFTKIFHKIVILLYRNDVVTEQAIRKWFTDAHLPKGKINFLEQMKGMIKWLDEAEVESDIEPIAT